MLFTAFTIIYGSLKYASDHNLFRFSNGKKTEKNNKTSSFGSNFYKTFNG